MERKNILTEECNSLEKIWSESESCAQENKKTRRIPGKQGMGVSNNDGKTYNRRLCEILDIMNGQLNN